MSDFNLTVTPHKASLGSRPAKGMGVFEIKVVDGNNDEEVACLVELPKSIMKAPLPTAEVRNLLTSWLAFRLLDPDNAPVRALVEHAWQCTFHNLVTNELIHGGLDVTIRQSLRNHNAWVFDWREGQGMQQYAVQAMVDDRATQLEKSLPNPGTRQRSPGRF